MVLDDFDRGSIENGQVASLSNEIERTGWPLLPLSHAPELAEDEVHLWCVPLDAPADEFISVLSTGERDRAARFHFDLHRRRFMTAHGVLRVLLGRYLRTEPRRLRFCAGAFGKPALAEEFDGARLQFNLSHSEHLALYAMSRNREVGVDIEQMRPEFAAELAAEQFFSPREVAALRALPREAWVEGFFNCWTRKEAYIKAIGKGLSAPLDQFEVSVTPGEPACLLKPLLDREETRRWMLRSFHPQPGFIAALAVESQARPIGCRQWMMSN